MSTSSYTYTLFGLTLAGTLFSGYLSGVKLFTNTCAFGEGCPLFLGYPACYFGFILFFALLVTVLLSVFTVIRYVTATKILIGISALGILFAGRYVLAEISQMWSSGFTATILGLPTCAYGLIFFVLVFACAYKFKKIA